VTQRKVRIVLSLVEESREKTDKELEDEMTATLSDTCFPWCKGIEQIKIIDE
jgi:hypothetical protein